MIHVEDRRDYPLTAIVKLDLPSGARVASADFLVAHDKMSVDLAPGKRSDTIRITYPKAALLRSGTLVLGISHNGRQCKETIDWTPGQTLLATPCALRDEDIAHFRRVEAAHPEHAERQPCDISFVILAKNEAAFIAACIRGVRAQRGLGSFEIIVIDSGSTDRTAIIAHEEGAYVFGIGARDFGHGRTRNLGAYLARGRLVCILNADAIPVGPEWFAHLASHLATGAAGACSLQIPRADCDPIRAHELRTWPIAKGRTEALVMKIDSLADFFAMDPAQRRQVICFETVSCLVTRALLAEVPFKNLPFGEDFEWAKRVLERGLTLVLDPASQVTHSHDLYRHLGVALRKGFDDHHLLVRQVGNQIGHSFGAYFHVFCVMLEKDAEALRSAGLRGPEWLAWRIRGALARICQLTGSYLATRDLGGLSDRVSLVAAIKRSA